MKLIKYTLKSLISNSILISHSHVHRQLFFMSLYPNKACCSGVEFDLINFKVVSTKGLLFLCLFNHSSTLVIPHSFGLRKKQVKLHKKPLVVCLCVFDGVLGPFLLGADVLWTSKAQGLVLGGKIPLYHCVSDEYLRVPLDVTGRSIFGN